MTIISDTDTNTMDANDGIAERDLCEKEYIPITINGSTRTCRCITCRPGFQAHICNTMDADTSFCEECQKGQFMPNASVLGRMKQCKYWRQCDEPHMTILSEGASTHDRKCTCTGNHRLTSDSGACIYQDPSKIDVTNPPRKSDATKPLIKSEDPNSPFPVRENPSSGSVHWKVIAPAIAMSILVALVILVIFLLWRRRKRNNSGQIVEEAPEREHLLERSIQDIKDRDLQSKVLTFCCKELEPKIGKDWSRLGRHLLDHRLDYAVEGKNDCSIEEKVSVILSTWRMQQGYSATPCTLLDALRSIRRQDIIDHLCRAVHDDPALGMHFRRDEAPDVVIN